MPSVVFLLIVLHKTIIDISFHFSVKLQEYIQNAVEEHMALSTENSSNVLVTSAIKEMVEQHKSQASKCSTSFKFMYNSECLVVAVRFLGLKIE